MLWRMRGAASSRLADSSRVRVAACWAIRRRLASVRSAKSCSRRRCTSPSASAFWALCSCASVRSTNWPTCVPIASIMASRSGSGSAISALKNSMTPMSPPAAGRGKQNAPCSPTFRAAGRRGKFGSSCTSGIHADCPLAQTRPGRPTPDANVMPWLMAEKSANCTAGACQMSPQRRTPFSRSMVQSPDQCQPRLSQMAFKMAGMARPSVSDSASTRVVACCAA